MLTKLRVRNFKLFQDVEIELGDSVVFIGPNNSGKTSALQALALWQAGARAWSAKYDDRNTPAQRPGITINRQDLTALPVPRANLLWRDLHVRNVEREGGKTKKTNNILINIAVDGITEEREWRCGLEFDFGNPESFYCRPQRLDDNPQVRMPFPKEAAEVNILFLPPLSGLAAIEDKLEPGSINRRLGEGQTAQVLRNLCYRLVEPEADPTLWREMSRAISKLFGVELMKPEFIKESGRIVMSYRNRQGIEFDLSSAGRGMHQTIMLLAFMYANPRTVLLLDEPDAHLEIIRQRQIYNLLVETAQKQGSQLIVASHSEVVLGEAADRDLVISFVGRPHRIAGRGSQVAKALRDIGFDQYYQAEVKGWVLYLEGSTDLAILRSFAEILDHRAKDILTDPFVSYVKNQPANARNHFFGLLEAKPDLVGIAIFDRLKPEQAVQAHPALTELMWKKQEIENYLCMQEALLNFARGMLTDTKQSPGLFELAEKNRNEKAMQESIQEIAGSFANLNKPEPWTEDVKTSDDYLDPLFVMYFKKINRPNTMRKTNFHVLAKFVPKELIDPEVIEKLDTIVTTAEKANPRTD